MVTLVSCSTKHPVSSRRSMSSLAAVIVSFVSCELSPDPWPTIRGDHPPKPIMHIAYSPSYSHKIYKFPHLFRSEFINVSPIFVQLTFLLNLRFLLPPYIDHDAFMKYASCF